MLKIICAIAIILIICLVYFLLMPPLVQIIFWFSCGIFFIFIAPLVYRWRIIPNIEKRYGQKLIFSYPSYKFNLISHAYIEVASHIVISLLGYTFKNRYEAMHKINYDVKTAPKTEIIISFITVGSGVLGLLIPLINLLY